MRNIRDMALQKIRVMGLLRISGQLERLGCVPSIGGALPGTFLLYRVKTLCDPAREFRKQNSIYKALVNDMKKTKTGEDVRVWKFQDREY